MSSQIQVLSLMLFFINQAHLTTASFNMTQFLNMTNESRTNIDYYERWHLCPVTDKDYHCCSCEGDCMKQKQCCINKFWNSSFISRQDEYIRNFIAQSRQYKNQECSYLIPKRFVKVDGEIFAYYMVTSCDLNFTEKHIIDKCNMGNFDGNSMEYYITVKDNNNYLYRNKYCAMCNSVSEFITPSLISGCRQCMDLETFEDGTTICHDREKECRIRLKDPEVKECYYGTDEVNRNCSRDNKYYDLCRSFLGPVAKKYANYFCYLCNGGSTTLHPYVYPCEPKVPDLTPFSWSSLLRFDYDQKDHSCKSVEVLDGKTEKCSSFVCPTGYEARNDKCIAVKKEVTKPILSIKDASFDKCLQARHPRINLKGFSNYSTALRRLFGNKHQPSEQIYLIPSSCNGKLIYGLEQNKSLEFIKSNEQNIADSIKENETITLAVSNPMTNSLSESMIFPNNLICANPILIKLFFNFTDSCDVVVNGERILFSNISLVLEISEKGFKRNVYTCEKYHLSKQCPRKILNGNYTTINNDSTLIYKEGNVLSFYHIHEYEPYKDGTFTVCIESNTVEKSPSWFSTVNEIAGYVSIVGSSCSILCYILLISTILQFKELQNVPGLCTLALSINLFVGDVLFLTSNLMYTSERYKHLTTLCDVIGILIHFFILSAQIWGLVMAIDISINLTKANFTNQNNKRKFIWFNVISVLLAVILIAIALVLRDKNILDVSYNKNGMCILHGFYSRIFLFFLPILLCFFVSSTVLTISIGYISKERRQRESVLEGSVQNKTSIVKVALKLVVLCGVAEGIGIINIPIERNSSYGFFVVNSIFVLLHSFVKAFRGVMLCIAYVCRKPVYLMYRRRHYKSGSPSVITNNYSISKSSMGSRNNSRYKESQM